MVRFGFLIGFLKSGLLFLLLLTLPSCQLEALAKEDLVGLV